MLDVKLKNCLGTIVFFSIFLGQIALSKAFDIQGHRGARGLMPENTLPAFSRALSIGVTTLELDLAVTSDGIVVVTHNPRLHENITRHKSGEWLTEKSDPIHILTYSQLRQFDVGRVKPGSRYAKKFPEQMPVDGSIIPTLGQVFELAKQAGNTQVRFNIETKIHPGKPDLTLAPDQFVQAILKVVHRHGLEHRVTLQSFDWRTLQAIKKADPEITTAYLSVSQPWFDTLAKGEKGVSPWLAGFDIDEFQQSVPRLIKAAGGDIWSPYHKEVSEENIALAHELGLKVKVWTVNENHRMRELIAMGVDGIITDYPDRLRLELSKLKMTLPERTPLK